MSVYIKGMEMPKSCYKCYLRQRNGMDFVCPVTHERFSITDVNILEYRLDRCPLVPVPEHGRLVDADALPTNADRIRHATDEEIEDWYWWMHKEMMHYTDSRVFVHDWLKAPVEEVDE